LKALMRPRRNRNCKKRGLTIARQNSDTITKETGVQPSLAEDEMKEYLDMVANENNLTKHDALLINRDAASLKMQQFIKIIYFSTSV
jgi:hypothetical protein